MHKSLADASLTHIPREVLRVQLKVQELAILLGAVHYINIQLLSAGWTSWG
jgi:hypothetical protein